MASVDQFAHLGGVYLNNKVRATVNGVSVVVARMEGDGLVLTPEGDAALQANPAPVESEVKKAVRTRKIAAVESSDNAQVAGEPARASDAE